MTEREGARQPTMLVFFLINLIIGLLWGLFFPLLGWLDYEIGLIVGLVILGIVNREYGRRAYHLLTFVVFVIWQIILSNVKLAWTIIQPKERLDEQLTPGIVAVPLTVTHNLEIMLLASVITLTPGTISIDLSESKDGDPVLYVHNLQLTDRERFVREIKEGFEQRILRFSRGSDSAPKNSGPSNSGSGNSDFNKEVAA